MKMLASLASGAALAMLAASCASSPPARVMQREGGLTDVVASGKQESEALVHAIDTAEDYCKDRKKSAIFISRTEEEESGKCPETDAERTLRFLKKLPVVGRALQDGGEPKVILPFKCA